MHSPRRIVNKRTKEFTSYPLTPERSGPIFPAFLNKIYR